MESDIVAITKIYSLSIANDAITSSKIIDGGVFANDISFTSTDAFVIPVGNTDQRPLSATTGSIRFNTDTNTVEGFNGISWGTLSGGGGVGGGETIGISNIQITNSSYSTTDDTAISISGGYIKINGSNFNTNTEVYVGVPFENESNAVNVSLVSNTSLNVELPPKSVGSYAVYAFDSYTNYGTFIKDIITFSTVPFWNTGKFCNLCRIRTI